MKHTAVGQGWLLLGAVGWQFLTPPCCWEMEGWKKGSKSSTGRQRHIHRHPLRAGTAQPGVTTGWTRSSCLVKFPGLWISSPECSYSPVGSAQKCCLVPVPCWIWEDLQAKRSSICCIIYQEDNAAQTTPSPQPAHTLAMLSRAGRIIPAPCESHLMKPSRKNVQETEMK